MAAPKAFSVSVRVAGTTVSSRVEKTTVLKAIKAFAKQVTAFPIWNNCTIKVTRIEE